MRSRPAVPALALGALVLYAASVAGLQAPAAYTVNFGLVTDLEELRPLIEECTDIGHLESARHHAELSLWFQPVSPSAGATPVRAWASANVDVGALLGDEHRITHSFLTEPPLFGSHRALRAIVTEMLK